MKGTLYNFLCRQPNPALQPLTLPTSASGLRSRKLQTQNLGHDPALLSQPILYVRIRFAILQHLSQMSYTNPKCPTADQMSASTSLLLSAFLGQSRLLQPFCLLTGCLVGLSNPPLSSQLNYLLLLFSPCS